MYRRGWACNTSRSRRALDAALGALAIAAALGACGACCGAPAEVRHALANHLDDLRTMERELVPRIPTGVTAPFGPVEKDLREGWRARIRGMQLHIEGLVAWAEVKPFDKDEATERLLGGLASPEPPRTPEETVR